MKKITVITLFLIPFLCLSQEAVHNFGNLKIHNTGAIGFHHHLINDGFTDDNRGVAGFFSDESITISGALKPVFHDMEIMVADHLFLDVSVGVTHNTNFILGDLITPRNFRDITLEYNQNAFYNGDANDTKIDGYSSTFNRTNFTFPIGHEAALRPLGIETSTPLTNARSAYFFENPNTPSTFTESFDTKNRDNELALLSEIEFWDIDCDIPSQVRLTWNETSQVGNYVFDIEELRVVGWHTVNEQWENLGNTLHKGGFFSGIIISDTFIPDDYTVITLGGILTENTTTAPGVLSNYLITPNNDGVNDFLVLKEIDLNESPNNILKIHNRLGRLVFSENNYKNSFDGKANTNTFIGEDKTLPSGLYFYTIELFDIDTTHQGYLYINE